MNPPSAGPAIEATGEGRADQPLVAAAVARRDDHADRGEREREEPACAEALDGPEEDELGHVLREAAERRADEEDRDRDHEEGATAVDVAELAVERHRDGRGEHVRGDDPGVAGQPADVADDPRQRSRDDRLVERREHEHRHQPRVDGEDAADREPVALRLAREPLARARSFAAGHQSHAASSRQPDADPDRDSAHDLQPGQGFAQQQHGEDHGHERLRVREQRRVRGADAVDGLEPEDVRQDERAEDGEDEQRPDLPAEVEVLPGQLWDRGDRDERSSRPRARSR